MSKLVTGYESEMAHLCAELCRDAYEGPEHLTENWNGYLDIEAIYQFEQGHIEGYVLVSPSMVWVQFVGSNDLIDWRRNFKTNLVPSWDAEMLGVKAKVHAGFQEGFDLVRPQLQELLEQILKETSGDIPIVVTGHSLGGALAQLFALSLSHHELASPYAVYTYGSPRVGDGAFAKLLTKEVRRLFNIQNSGDLAPHVPLLTCGYRTAGTSVYITANGEKLSDPGILRRTWSLLRLLAQGRFRPHASDLYAIHLKEQ